MDKKNDKEDDRHKKAVGDILEKMKAKAKEIDDRKKGDANSPKSGNVTEPAVPESTSPVDAKAKDANATDKNGNSTDPAKNPVNESASDSNDPTKKSTNGTVAPAADAANKGDDKTAPLPTSNATNKTVADEEIPIDPETKAPKWVVKPNSTEPAKSNDVKPDGNPEVNDTKNTTKGDGEGSDDDLDEDEKK